ncbi:hypothetical protein EON81_13400, partial [bacterium]
MRRTAMGLAGTKQIDPKSSVKTIEGFNALGTLGGAATEEISRALVQLKQVASNGRLMGDELNLIQEAGIPLRALLQDKGMGDRFGSTTNPIKWSEIQQALIEFGADPKTQQALTESTDTASRSLGVLGNVVNYDLLPALGEAFSPAIKAGAETVSAWAKELDPAAIQGWTTSVLDNWKSILLFGAGVKGLQLWFASRLPWSANAAATALDRLAASATVAGAAQGGGGIAAAAKGGVAALAPGIGAGIVNN